MQFEQIIFIPNTIHVHNQEENYCETCEKCWETAEELEEHIAEHVTCGIQGCQFTAHPKIITQHVTLQHNSGLYEKISKPDDVSKWIADRKKNYPTTERIAYKELERAEKIKRGEVLEDDPRQPRKRFTGDDERRNKRFNKRRRRVRNSHGNIVGEEIVVMDGLPPSSIEEGRIEEINEEEIIANEDVKNEDFSDDEWFEDKTNDSEKPPQLCTSLLALSNAYNSDSEDEKDTPKKPHDERKSNININNSNWNENLKSNLPNQIKESEINEKINNEEEESDDEPPVETKIMRVDINTPNLYIDKCEKPVETKKDEKIINETAYKERQESKNDKPKHKENVIKMRKRPPTLLEKLLAKEIKKERNYILQCIRYIVDNNYFESNQDSKKTTLTKSDEEDKTLQI